ncbi:MAG: 50S ribosomal protein L5 [Candidatus Marsarchaeota archaeon]|jgi:large subunit ribosomal protein L5|nr:50S ribosomal protein L5 [Candidatus Marsarchaeota archaeon]
MAKQNPTSKNENPMRLIRINKLVINIGTGNDDKLQANAKKLLQQISSFKPADSISTKRIPQFKISKGAKIGAFVTVRSASAKALAKRLFDAVGDKVPERSIQDNTVNFGIKEYIDITGIKYDPVIGMLGMNVNVSFKRPGLRTELKKRANGVVKRTHRRISKEELKSYLEKEFGVTVEGAAQ